MRTYNRVIKIHVKEPTVSLKVSINASGEGGGALPYYTGSYDVRPQVTPQILPTANKSMAKDVTIQKIPLDKVSNQYGDTVIIGGI